MYADGIVLVGESVIHIQRKINIVESFCRTYGMKVNLDETEVMPFRKGGKTAKKESFYYIGLIKLTHAIDSAMTTKHGNSITILVLRGDPKSTPV